MLSLIHQTEKPFGIYQKGSETMPTLQEFKENILALLDIMNEN